MFLDGSLLGVDESTLVGIDGAYAQYIDGTTAGTSVVDNAPLDTTALMALPLPLPDLALNVGDVLDIGLIQQQAEAYPEGASTASTSTAGLGIDLMQLIPATPVLSTANIQLGAIQSEATLAADGTLTRTTTLADATLNLESPAIGTLVDTVNAIVAPVNATVNTALATLSTALTAALAPVNGTFSVNSRLDDAIANVLTTPLSTSLVTLDPSTGTITVNLAGGINLNDIPPNTQLLSPAMIQQITADIASLTAQLQSNINDILTNATDYIDVTIAATLTVPLGGTATMNYTGTLADIPTGLNATGSGLALTTMEIAETAVKAAVATATTTITTAVSGTGALVDQAATVLSNALAPVMGLVDTAVSIELNVQNASDGLTSTASVTAIEVGLLGDVLTLPLVTSSVGPNIQLAVPPTIAATDTVAGTPTTVSGGDWPANMQVSLQVTDAAGNPVGDPIVVTTDATGAIPATAYPIPGDATPGTFTITGTALAADGTPTTLVVSNTFEVAPDVTAPAVPVVVTPADGSLTTDSTPDVTGTVPVYEPGLTVDVTITNPAGSTTVIQDVPVTDNGDGTGSWATVVPDGTPLADGEHTVTATTTDLAGNVSDPSAPNTFTVDTTAPDAPTITGPTDGALLTDNTPDITGTVPVYEDGMTVDVTLTNPDGSTTVLQDVPVTDADGDGVGEWTVPAGTLPDGDYTVTATATDAAGNVSDPSAPVDFTVDTTAPAAPTITGPTDGALLTDNTPDITGTVPVYEDGMTVDVTLTNPDGSTTVLQDVPVTDADGDGVGEWTVPAGTLPDGDYTVTATSTDAAGNVSDPSAPVAFTVDTVAPDAPTITGPADGALLTDNTPDITGTVPVYEDGMTVDVTITNPDGSTTVLQDVPVTDADGDGVGEWTVPAGTLPDGDYTVTATATDAAGNVSDPSAPVDFTVDTTAPDAPTITGPTDGALLTDNTPDITGTVPVYEDGMTVDVTITNPDGSTTVLQDVPVTDADGDGVGEWTVPAGTLGDGDYTVTATATDAAGNVSDPSAPVAFTVDTVAPDAPTITGPTDGALLTDNTPDITGTVPVYEDGMTVDVTITNPDGSTTVLQDVPVTDADGDGVGEWTVPAGTLGDGDYTVTATSTDAAGNVSTPSAPVDFTVDTTAPDAPTITGPTDGALLTDNTPDITGTVPVYEDGMTVDVTITNPDGSTTVLQDVPVTDADGDGVGEWTVPAGTLGDGDYTVTATATDAAGNVSDPSAPVDFTVDTVAPDAPTITGPTDGAVLTDNTPDITGTVPVYEDGMTVDVTITNPDGSTTVLQDVPVTDADGDGVGEWTVPAGTLGDGDYTVTATATDAAGNVSDPSAPVGFTVDATAPDAPTITGPTDGALLTDNTPDITGTVPVYEPGLTVDVTITNPDGSTTVIEDVPVTDADGDGVGEWTVPAGTLDDGDYTVTATVTDPAGNVSDPSAPVGFTVDTVAPDAPVITTPIDGTTTPDSTPPISGTAEPGTTVDVTITNPDGTTTVIEDVPVTDPDGDGVGEWTVTPTLTEGEHTVTATATDPAGNTSPVSDPVTFVVDTTAPDAPVVTSPTDGSTTDDDTPTITGTGEPGATVDVYIDGELVAEDVPVTDADGDGVGEWSVTLLTPLDDGEHVVTATQTDEAGNVSPESDPVAFTVDTTAPDAPIILGPRDGAVTSDTTPEIFGTAEPNTTVDVTITNPDGTTTVYEDVPVSAGGEWTITPTTDLAEGDHTITVVATDEVGHVSPPSDPVTVTIDVTDPAAPVITGPAAGSVTDDSTPVISGTAEPGTTVDVTIVNPDGTTTVIQDVPVVDTDGDGVGEWFVTTPELGDGLHVVTAVATDDAGNTSPVSDPVAFTVDTTAPDAPVITSPTDGQVIGDTTPAITGTGEPGATVEVTIDGVVVGETTVDENGDWTFTPTDPLSDGDHTVTATQTDEAGNTSPASPEVVFTVDSTVPAVDITSPAPGDLVGDSTPTITGTGEPGDTITVIVDGVEIGETTVDENGDWTFTPTDPLGDGDHTVEVIATDDAGNTATDGPISFTVDTTAPDAPVITSPTDGDTLTDPTPTITGTGEPGSTITIIVDGVEIGETTVDEDGNWTFTPTDPLEVGPHEITATATDPAGNTSEPSAPVNVTLPDYDPVITIPDDTVTPGTDIPVTGGGFPPDTEVVVVITDGDGVPITDPVTVVTDENGDFETVVTVPIGTPPGEYIVDASTPDGIGTSVPITVVPSETPPPAGPGDDEGDLDITGLPGQLERGDTVTFCGTGFQPGESVTAVVHSTPITIGTARADESGRVCFTWTVRSDTALGAHTMTLTGQVSGSVSRPFSVVSGALAATGAVVWPSLALGALALGAGALLMIRRRREEQLEV